MSDIKQREYYKIFTGTNQEGGYDKIHLGYEAETTEINFNRDQTTFFHMPFFASSQSIAESTLIADGAVPGPIPALADRVFKKLGNYGNTTPWGTASERSDGTWLCSWLYALSSEPPVWKDRYYNPGRLAYWEALAGEANFTDYIKNEELYYDIDSTLTFEPGVLYQYFHQGESTALDVIKTFAGEDKTRLKLDIEDWSCACPDDPEPVDKSIYDNKVIVSNFKNDWVVSLFDPGFLDRSSLSFNNTDFIDAKVIFNQSYNLEDEFTLSFWVYSPDWTQATSTQLVGNLRKGGYGIFYNNLYYNPYFVIPENTYGHLFYCNQESVVYTDKNTQSILGVPSSPVSNNINSNAEVISVDALSGRVIKYNHIGDVLTFSKDLSGNGLNVNGVPKLSILDGYDNLTVITTLSTYTFNKDLLLTSFNNIPYGYKEQVAYDQSGVLIRELSCLDVKFDNYNQKWVIKDDGNLYCNNVLLTSVPTNGTGSNIAVDPNNDIWFLANYNKIYKINTIDKNLKDTYEVGVLTDQPDEKNISFIKAYSRSSNSFTWYSVLYHDFEKTLYFVTLDGKVFNDIFLPQNLNTLDPATQNQNVDALTFTGKGDFTGYEQKRIFNKILYNNNPQLQLKVAVKSPNRSLPNTTYTLSVPAQYLADKAWHLVTGTFKNHTLKLFVDNYLRDSIKLSGNLDLNYEFKNDLFIGSPCGKTDNLNKEINSTSVIWNGYIDTVRVYDYAVEAKFILFFVREKILATDITWNIPTAALQYVEVIERFFKHKMPGSKSVFFKIKLSGTSITDTALRKRIEEDIKVAVLQLKPAYAELLKVEWME
jgi:hypothetical protein